MAKPRKIYPVRKKVLPFRRGKSIMARVGKKPPASSNGVYKVRIAQAAADFIREQSAKIQRQILDKISFLAKDPYNRGERIKGTTDMFKIRSGDYRIAYKVEKGQLLILVVRVGHRRDFYRFFDK